MQRVIHVAVIVPLLLLAAPAGAQTVLPGQDRFEPRLRFTPFVLYAPAASRMETRTPVRATGATDPSYRVEVDIGQGIGVGGTLEYRFAGPVGLFAGTSFVSRNRGSAYSEIDGPLAAEPGSDFLMHRAGLSIGIQERAHELQLRRLDARVYAGPTWTIEFPQGSLNRPNPGSTNMYGAHFGADAELPLRGGRMALHAGFEDNVLWWNRVALRQRVDAGAPDGGLMTTTHVATGPTHFFLLRVGATLRLH
jgi:hypothetical protein